MIPSRETLFELQKEHRFSTRTLEVAVRLREILRSVGENQFLSDSLVLKGGSALNLCFGSPPRLSVDLDFNYVGTLEVEGMKNERPNLIAILERIARLAGYRVQFSAEEHAGKRLYLKYASAFGGEGTLQIAVNFLHRIPLGAIREMPVWDPGEGQIVLTKVVPESELIAGKAVAILDRTAPRDYYDISILPKRTGPIDIIPGIRSVLTISSWNIAQESKRWSPRLRHHV